MLDSVILMDDRRLAFPLLLLSAFLISGCDTSSKEELKAIVKVSLTDKAQAGKRVYEKYCIGCHGREGDGKGPAAPFLKRKPRNFRDEKFKYKYNKPPDAPVTNQDIFTTITIGVPDTAMPSWRLVPENERWAVLEFIKTFSQGEKEEGLHETR